MEDQDDYIFVSQLDNKENEIFKDSINFNPEQNVIFDLKPFFKDIMQSYKDTLNIISQFTRDFPRIDIEINNESVKDVNIFVQKLLNEKPVTLYENIQMPKIILHMLICCQSSFAIIYSYISAKYNSEGYAVTSSNSKKYVCIFTDDDSYLIKTIFTLVSTETGKIVKNIIAEMFFSLYHTYGIVQYDIVVVK